MSNHVLIIRFHYAQDDPRFQWRFDFFKAMVLPRLLGQTDQDFDIAIRCHHFHEELFKSLSPKIKTFQVKNEGAHYKLSSNGKKYFEDFANWEDVIGLDKYDIQSGLDSDDLVDKNYIKIIKQHCTRPEPIHICFQPKLLNLKTMQIRPMMEYKSHRGSAFLSLYQPDKKRYKFLYHQSHISMYIHAKKSIVIPAGHCWATAHWINESTGV